MKKYELCTIQGKEIILDISQLLKDEVLSINVTSLAKQFEKSRQEVNRFLKSKGFVEYQKALVNVGISDDVKLIEKYEGRYGGTYLHSDLLIVFLRWLNKEFAVKCDLYIKRKIKEVHDEKSKNIGRIQANKANKEWVETRDNGKNSRKLLTDKIKEFCEYAELQRGEPYKICPYYKHITDAIYAYIGVKVSKDDRTSRDVYSGDIVEDIETAELKVITILDEVMESEGSRKGIKNLITNRLTHEMGYIV